MRNKLMQTECTITGKKMNIKYNKKQECKLDKVL